VRVLVSARTSGLNFDLRCEIREKLIDFLQREYAQTLPRRRLQVVDGGLQPGRDRADDEPAHQPRLS
jgi:hypothetical protein